MSASPKAHTKTHDSSQKLETWRTMPYLQSAQQVAIHPANNTSFPTQLKELVGPLHLNTFVLEWDTFNLIQAKYRFFLGGADLLQQCDREKKWACWKTIFTSQRILRYYLVWALCLSPWLFLPFGLSENLPPCLGLLILTLDFSLSLFLMINQVP